MQIFDPGFVSSLQAAREGGIAPVYFFWVRGRGRESGEIEELGLWSGDEDIAQAVESPAGGSATRPYLGGCNLRVEGIEYVADLTDNPVTVSLSQIADAAQHLVRGLDVRLAYCEIHAATRNGGALTSAPQLQWVGIIDDVMIATPEVGGEGSIGFSVRSELMAQLTAINPAKSSDSHQKRRRSDDRFSEYSGVIRSRKIQWYKADKK